MKEEAGMVHNVMSVTAVLASLSVFAGAVCAAARWLRRRTVERAVQSAREQDRLERLEKELAATAARLEEIRNKLQNKPWRWFS